MSPVFKTLVNISIWILFTKGILIALVTLYTFGRVYLNGEGTPMVGVVSCIAGTFAFISACAAIWIRRKIE
jgi:hypothetical protein